MAQSRYLEYLNNIPNPSDIDVDINIPISEQEKFLSSTIDNNTALIEPSTKPNLGYLDYLKKKDIVPIAEVQKPVESKSGYFEFLKKQEQEDDDISFAREFAYGVAQEPTALGSIFRISKAALQSFTNFNESYEQARARIEKDRQEKILERFPEFRGRQETAGVLAGRAGVALADPITFFVPWMKIAKAGKVASLGAGGAFAATDIALREEALYGEVRPEMVGLGFGLGVVGAGIGELGMAIYNRGVSQKIEVLPNQTKSVDIPGPTKVKAKENEISVVEDAGIKTVIEAEKNIDNVGSLFLKIKDIQTQKEKLFLEVKEVQNKLKKFKSVTSQRKYTKQLKNLEDKKKSLNLEILKLNNRRKKIQADEIPDELLEIYTKGMVNGFKRGILNENFARALTQELTRPIFGGIIGGGIGASFTEEGDDNTLMYSFAIAGATLGKFQKTIQSKPFELIPQNIKDAAGNEFLNGFRRSFYNQLKSLSAGSHIGHLMSWSPEVGLNFGARMYQPMGVGKTLKSNPVENEALLQSALFRNLASDIFGGYSDDVLILAGKITNQKGLKSNKHSFLTKEDRLNPNFALATQISKEIDEFTDVFKNYMRNRGIDFQDETFYGLTQLLNQKSITPINRAEVLKTLEGAFKIQNENIKKITTAKQRADKEFMELNYPTFGSKPKDLARGYLNAATSVRTNSLFEEGDDLLFKSNGNTDYLGKKFVSKEEDFIIQAARHFDKRRTLFDQEARAFAKDLFVDNPKLTITQLIGNSIKVAEFSKAFGAKGEGIKELFRKIDLRYKKLADPDNKFSSVRELYSQLPNVQAAARKEKAEIKASIEAFFGVYRIEKAPTGDAAQLFTTLLQTGLATTRLLRVAIPSTGDLVQTITNSGYGPAFKSAMSQIKKSMGKEIPLSVEGLATLSGKGMSDSALARELQDVLLVGHVQGARKYQHQVSDFTTRFFEVIQLGRITRFARNFAFDAGVYRTMDIVKANKKGKVGEFLKSKDAIIQEIGDLGLTVKDINYLSSFKNIEDALQNTKARALFKKAGVRSANRDAIIPLVGNRRLFTQTRNPYVKFLGSFLSWSQGKTSQLNSLVSRIEQGDIALFLKIAASIPILAAVREAQVALSTSPDYKKGVSDETLQQKVGEAIGFSGLNTYGVEKLRGFFKYSDYGSSPVEQVAPVLGYMNDILEIPLKTVDAFKQDEEFMKNLENAFLVAAKETADILPVVREIPPLIKENLTDEDEKYIIPKFTTGGLVKGPKVRNTKEDAADAINPYTGLTYSGKTPVEQQMEDLLEERIGFAEGTNADSINLKFLQDYHNKNFTGANESKGNLDKELKGKEVSMLVGTFGIDDKYYILPTYAKGIGGLSNPVETFIQDIKDGKIIGYSEEEVDEKQRILRNAIVNKERTGFANGGEYDSKNIIDDLSKQFMNPKEQRNFEADAAESLNKLVSEQRLPEEYKLNITGSKNKVRYVEGSNDAFNALKHYNLGIKYGDSVIGTTLINAREVGQILTQGRFLDSAQDIQNNIKGIAFLREAKGNKQEALMLALNDIEKRYKTNK